MIIRSISVLLLPGGVPAGGGGRCNNSYVTNLSFVYFIINWYLYFIKIFFQQLVHFRIVGFQLYATIHRIVYTIGRISVTVTVEERLYTFRKVFFFVA